MDFWSIVGVSIIGGLVVLIIVAFYFYLIVKLAVQDGIIAARKYLKEHGDV